MVSFLLRLPIWLLVVSRCSSCHIQFFNCFECACSMLPFCILVNALHALMHSKYSVFCTEVFGTHCAFYSQAKCFTKWLHPALTLLTQTHTVTSSQQSVISLLFAAASKTTQNQSSIQQLLINFWYKPAVFTASASGSKP